MAPAVTKGIPIWVRNTFAPEKPGTLICAAPTSNHAVKGITSIDAVALVNVEGAGMIGVPGTAQRLFGALREDGISVILISQGSSEHSICFAVPEQDAERTAATVRRAFAMELRDGQIQDVDALTGHSILSVVGDGMAGTPGIAADVFGALAGAGVNVRAIAQGSSERNISVVIDARQTTRALRSVHARLLPVAAHDLDRPGGPGRGGQRAARADRLAGAAAAARLPARPARARPDDVEEDAAVRSVDRHRRLEGQADGGASRWTWRGSRTTCTRTTCRTR